MPPVVKAPQQSSSLPLYMPSTMLITSDSICRVAGCRLACSGLVRSSERCVGGLLGEWMGLFELAPCGNSDDLRDE